MPTLLDHGYDELTPPPEWTSRGYAAVAAHRGGALADHAGPAGDLATPLTWREVRLRPRVTATPRLVLTGGHWCPACVTDVAGYARQAERNTFLAQVVDAHPGAVGMRVTGLRLKADLEGMNGRPPVRTSRCAVEVASQGRP